MVLCADDTEADQVNLALSARRARKKADGIGVLEVGKAEAVRRRHDPGRPPASGAWNLLPTAAAEFFSVTETELAKWRRHGVGPVYIQFQNGAVRYNVDELAAWLADGFYVGGESWESLVSAGVIVRLAEDRDVETSTRS